MIDATATVVDDKTVANLRARAALAGWELIPLPDGAFIASRWGMHRDLPHAESLREEVRRMSISQALARFRGGEALGEFTVAVEGKPRPVSEPEPE